MLSVEDNAGFASIERIKSSLAIRSVVKDGASVNAYPLKCFYRHTPRSRAPVQLAVVVSKRRFKHAVDRNRVKRLMRESFRLQKRLFSIHQDATLQMCWLFVGQETPSFVQVYKAVGRIARKLYDSQDNTRL